MIKIKAWNKLLINKISINCNKNNYQIYQIFNYKKIAICKQNFKLNIEKI